MNYSENNPLIKETFAYKMFGKRCRDLNEEERRAYYTERQREYRKNPEVMEKCRAYSLDYTRKHSKSKKKNSESFVRITFGKQYKELTSKEKSLYQLLLKGRRSEVLGRD